MNHVYLGSTAGQERRREYLRKAEDRIEKAFKIANEIFSRSHVHLRLAPIGPGSTEINAELENIEGDDFSPFGPEMDAMHAVHPRARGEIGVHWARLGSHAPTGWGSFPAGQGQNINNFVAMAGWIESGNSNEALARAFAHEIGHYFNLSHVTTSGSLMNPNGGPADFALSDSEIAEIRRVINTVRLTLVTVTCDAPVRNPGNGTSD